MKRIIAAVLLTVAITAPAVAAQGKNSVGVSYGLDLNGVFGLQGEFDISSMVNRAPVSAQVFWKNYSQTYFVPGVGNYKWGYNGFGVAAIYDFSSVTHWDRRLKPYGGLGLYALNSSFSGPSGAYVVAADTGGLYITGGIRYALTPQLSADLNYNNIGGLTIGANLGF